MTDAFIAATVADDGKKIESFKSRDDSPKTETLKNGIEKTRKEPVVSGGADALPLARERGDGSAWARSADAGESRRIASDLNRADVEFAKEYLSSYRFGCKMLSCREFESRYPELCGGDAGGDASRDRELDDVLVRTKMFDVKNFIMGIKSDGNVRLLLYWHYVRGVPVARCAEMLGISRAGAFRLRKRALEAAARSLKDKYSSVR